MSVGGGLGALQFFSSFKKGTRTFFRSNEPSRKILGPLGLYDNPWEKNKHGSVCLLAKNTKVHIFVDRSLKLEKIGFSDTLKLMV